MNENLSMPPATQQRQGESKNSFRSRVQTFILGFREINTTNWLDKMAEVYGDFPILHLDQPFAYPFLSTDRLGYRDIVHFMNRAGNALLELGIKAGDRVVLVPSNRIELGLLNFACHKIEAVPIPVNYMYRAAEIRQIVEDSEAKALITDNEVFEASIQRRSNIPSLRECLVLDDDAAEGCRSFSRMMNQSSAELAAAQGQDPRAIVQMFYSSGTTGTPKGAMLSRLGYLYFLRLFLGLGALTHANRNELLVTSLPLAHIMGMTLLIIRLTLTVPWYFLNRFDPKRVLELIQEKKATSFIGVPAMFSMLLAQGPENYDLSSILLFGSAADAMPLELMEKFRNLCPRRRFFPVFVEIYGQVETSGPTTIRVLPAVLKARPGSLGIPIPGMKVRVVDDTGREAPRGQVGELEVRGPMVTRGYWKRPDADTAAFDGPWFRTGDLVVRRGMFRLEFAGRKSERIKCGGYSLFPQEVEEELLRHPGISEAAVLGLPDVRKGEVPVAAVVLRQGVKASEEEILAWARENIARYKCPRQVRILEELPRGATQKVLKRELLRYFDPRRVGEVL